MRIALLLAFPVAIALAAEEKIDPLLKTMIESVPTGDEKKDLDETSMDKYWKKHNAFVKAFDDLAKRNNSDKYKLTLTTPPERPKTEKHGEITSILYGFEPFSCCSTRAESTDSEGKTFVVVVFSWESSTIPGSNLEMVLLFSADGKFLDRAGADNNNRYGPLRTAIHGSEIEIRCLTDQRFGGGRNMWLRTYNNGKELYYDGDNNAPQYCSFKIHDGKLKQTEPIGGAKSVKPEAVHFKN